MPASTTCSPAWTVNQSAPVELAVVLALAASFCTAMSSVCQRRGARSFEARARGFDLWLVFRLATRPAWVLGFFAMIAGFVLQVSALRLAPLALVQPILAAELLFVFGYLVVSHDRDRPGQPAERPSVTGRSDAGRLDPGRPDPGRLDPGRLDPGRPDPGRRNVGWRDWLAAAAMSAGLSVFLGAAAPSGGRPHASAMAWWLAGLATVAVAALVVAAAGGGSPMRRAAWLGIATGIGWGFVAAVIKELSSHVDGGLAAIFTTWSVYVLMAAGSAAMVLTSHAMAAGPLAASQPGFTVLDPVAASLLGVFLFREHVQASPLALTAEALGLIVAAIGAWALSGSDLIKDRG
jgi:drug/metabolite transporter (DMT)-like permease